jgi:hypothetical protein
MEWKRKKPVVAYTLLQETKDLIDTLSIATGTSRSHVVDKLIQYLANQHKVEDFIQYIVD